MSDAAGARRAGVRFDPYGIASPYYVVDLGLFRKNLELLARVQKDSGAKVLLALKGFAMWSVFPIAKQYLIGVTSSSVHEARLGREEFGGEVHAYAPAYSQADIDELLGKIASDGKPGSEGMVFGGAPAGAGPSASAGEGVSAPIADHIVFNSVGQFRKYQAEVHTAGVECGLRVNPEQREVETELYDPCAPGSRLGVRAATLDDARLSSEDLAALDGLHFHNLCQKNSDALERTVHAFEAKFGEYIPAVKWVNFGGGHHITRADYDVDRLVRVVRAFSERWGKQVYLEPGEASALNTGFLVAEVLDLVAAPRGGLPTAILDTSATAHMPDVLEMPYRPEILGGADPGAKAHTYRLGGLTCLAGDVIGDWSFDEPLEIGDRLVFTDMAHYTMVKTTTFNGVRHPSIATFEPETGELREVRRFGYDDYKRRLS